MEREESCEYMPVTRPQQWRVREARDDGDARVFPRLFVPKKRIVNCKAGGLRCDVSENGFRVPGMDGGFIEASS